MWCDGGKTPTLILRSAPYERVSKDDRKPVMVRDARKSALLTMRYSASRI